MGFCNNNWLFGGTCSFWGKCRWLLVAATVSIPFLIKHRRLIKLENLKLSIMSLCISMQLEKWDFQCSAVVFYHLSFGLWSIFQKYFLIHWVGDTLVEQLVKSYIIMLPEDKKNFICNEIWQSCAPTRITFFVFISGLQNISRAVIWLSGEN